MIQSPDLSALVFARNILLSNPKAAIHISVGEKSSFNIDGNTLEDLLNFSLESIFVNKTRFGRIGLLFDHHNLVAHEWAKTTDITKIAYTQKDKKRSLESPEIHLFSIQALAHLANEGLSDTVEFRRLARKELRKAKHSNVDTLLLCDPILGEERTKKILQHIAGNNIQVISVIDDWHLKTAESDKQSLIIDSVYNKEWTHHRSEQILKQKLSTNCIKC